MDDDVADQSDMDVLSSVENEVEEVLEKDADDSVDDTVDGDVETEEETEEEPEEETKEEGVLEPIFDKLKATDPDIFKKVPELRPILGRERQFSEIFSSPDEAKEASEKVQAFAQLSESVLSGDPLSFFRELSESSEESYDKFTENILPTLRKAHPEKFVKMVDPYIRQVLAGVANRAKQSGNNELWKAMGHVAKDLYGDPNIRVEVQKDDALEAERKRLAEERNKFEQSKLGDFEARAGKELDNRMTRMLSKAIDPENAYTDKMRNAMVADAISELTSIVSKDSAHRTRIQSLRKLAQQEGFSGEASERLISAVLARVKPLISSVRQKVVSEYVNSTKKQASKKADKKFIPGSSSVGAQKGKSVAQLKTDYSKSDLELLDS